MPVPAATTVAVESRRTIVQGKALAKPRVSTTRMSAAVAEAAVARAGRSSRNERQRLIRRNGAASAKSAQRSSIAGRRMNPARRGPAMQPRTFAA